MHLYTPLFISVIRILLLLNTCLCKTAAQVGLEPQFLIDIPRFYNKTITGRHKSEFNFVFYNCEIIVESAYFNDIQK